VKIIFQPKIHKIKVRLYNYSQNPLVTDGEVANYNCCQLIVDL